MGSWSAKRAAARLTDREWGWQWVFPAATNYIDRQTVRALSRSVYHGDRQPCDRGFKCLTDKGLRR